MTTFFSTVGRDRTSVLGKRHNAGQPGPGVDGLAPCLELTTHAAIGEDGQWQITRRPQASPELGYCSYSEYMI